MDNNEVVQKIISVEEKTKSNTQQIEDIKEGQRIFKDEIRSDIK
ncbi:MAG: hypothetical protein PHG19_03710 [Anaerotignum sp.]|nr:hypothetical protein [Anaerotignum sp.]